MAVGSAQTLVRRLGTHTCGAHSYLDFAFVCLDMCMHFYSGLSYNHQQCHIFFDKQSFIISGVTQMRKKIDTPHLIDMPNQICILQPTKLSYILSFLSQMGSQLLHYSLLWEAREELLETGKVPENPLIFMHSLAKHGNTCTCPASLQSYTVEKKSVNIYIKNCCYFCHRRMK